MTRPEEFDEKLSTLMKEIIQARSKRAAEEYAFRIIWLENELEICGALLDLAASREKKHLARISELETKIGNQNETSMP